MADLLERFDLTNSVTHLLRRAHTRADALFDEVMCTGELTPRQTALLVASHQHPGATMAALAAEISVDRNTLAEMVRRLIDRGLLERRPSEQDRRAWSVHSTPAGDALLRAILPNNARLMKEVMRPLPPEYRMLFLKCLRLMVGVEPPSETARSDTAPSSR
ncbi:MAG: MarR family winged helix-turn-helix transcriptional regulator [Solirubrobacteraceae bacterium]